MTSTRRPAPTQSLRRRILMVTAHLTVSLVVVASALSLGAANIASAVFVLACPALVCGWCKRSGRTFQATWRWLAIWIVGLDSPSVIGLAVWWLGTAYMTEAILGRDRWADGPGQVDNP